MEEEPKKKGVGWGMGILIFFVALFADGATLIPLAGVIVGPAYWIIFSWYLKKKGYGVFNLKTLVPQGFSVIAEMWPAIQALPTITAMSILILLITKVEDKVGLSNMRLPKKAPPFNHDKVRLPRKNNIVEVNFQENDEDKEMAT